MTGGLSDIVIFQVAECYT